MWKEFFHRERPVGYFKGEEWPATDGLYQYMAFRGPGHFMMAEILDMGQSADCYYITGDIRCDFMVMPESEGSGGFLKLEQFSIMRLDSSIKVR